MIKWFYKGHKVYKFYRYILSQFIIILSVIVLCTNIILYHVKFKNSTDELYKVVLFIILVTIIVTLATCLILYKFLYYLYNMQKLCQMIYAGELFGIKRKEGEVITEEYESKLSYYPSIYYRKRKNKNIEIAIKLDGSKNHEKYMKLGDILGQMYAMEHIDRKRKYWYVVHTLEEIKPNRLYMKGNIKIENNEIPIMKGLVWNYNKTPHALITGGTGGGKTYFLLYLITALVKMKADIKIIDPKRSDLYGLRHLLGTDKVVHGIGVTMKLLREAVEEMEKRYDIMDQDNRRSIGKFYSDYGLKPVFIIFDEFVAFIESLTESKLIKEVNSYMMRIVLEGRQAGYFIICSTQRPDAEYLKGSIRDNLGLRVALGGLEPSGYRMTFGDVKKEFEKFESGHGYLYMNGITTSVRESYAPYMGVDYDFYAELEKLVHKNEKKITDKSFEDVELQPDIGKV